MLLGSCSWATERGDHGRDRERKTAQRNPGVTSCVESVGGVLLSKRSKSAMKKVLTMKELESRYSGEWVLLVNPVHDKLMEPIRGELVFHSRTETKSTRKRTSGRTLTQPSSM